MPRHHPYKKLEDLTIVRMQLKAYGEFVVVKLFIVNLHVRTQPMHKFYQFHATALFLYPLKTSENIGFLMFSEGMERYRWNKMG